MKSIILMTSLVLLAAGCAKESSTSSGAASSAGGAATGTGSAAAPQLSSEDTKFVRQAGQSGLAQVRMGQLLSQNAQDPALKDFGQRLMDDQTKANQELAQLAAQKGLTLPTQMDSADQKMVERLAATTGPEFDQMAQKDLVKAHERAIEEFQKAAKDCQDPDLKAFAQKELPTLQEHLNTARKLSAGSSGGSQGGNSSSEGTSSQSGTSSQP